MKKELLAIGSILGAFGANAIPISRNTGTPSGQGKREKQGTYWGRPGAKIIRKFHSKIGGLPGKTRHERNAAGHKLPFWETES